MSAPTQAFSSRVERLRPPARSTTSSSRRPSPRPVPIGWVREPEDPWEQSARAGAFTPFTPPVNVAGLPAASVPFSWTDDGLPIGIHVIGRATDEPTLIRLSAQLEEARPWAERRPPGYG